MQPKENESDSIDKIDKLVYVYCKALFDIIDFTKTLYECDQQKEFANFVFTIDYVGKGDFSEAYRRFRKKQVVVQELTLAGEHDVGILFPSLNDKMSLFLEKKPSK